MKREIVLFLFQGEPQI